MRLQCEMRIFAAGLLIAVVGCAVVGCQESSSPDSPGRSKLIAGARDENGNAKKERKPNDEPKPPKETQPPPEYPDEEEEDVKPLPEPPEAKGAKRLLPDSDVWFHAKKKQVVLAGKIVRRDGFMELFACLKNSKEHESIVSVNTKAFVVHTLLLASGAKSGHPVRFRPSYRSATGQEIEITVHWTDGKGKRRTARAQDWIRNVKTGKALQHPFVFGGSGFWESEDGKQRVYNAEGGDLICISNFPSAMIDLPVESSQSNDALIYEGFKERIPKPGTVVAIVLTPSKMHPIEAPAAKE